MSIRDERPHWNESEIPSTSTYPPSIAVTPQGQTAAIVQNIGSNVIAPGATSTAVAPGLNVAPGKVSAVAVQAGSNAQVGLGGFSPAAMPNSTSTGHVPVNTGEAEVLTTQHVASLAINPILLDSSATVSGVGSNVGEVEEGAIAAPAITAAHVAVLAELGKEHHLLRVLGVLHESLVPHNRYISDAGGPVAAGVLSDPPLLPLPILPPILDWPEWTDIRLPPPGKRLALGAQHPLIQQVVRGSFTHVYASILFENSFPDAAPRAQAIRKAYLKSAQHRPGCEPIYRRMTQDIDYIRQLAVLCQARERISLFRAAYKDCALGGIIGMYSLPLVPGPALQSAVEHEMRDYTYIFPRTASGMRINHRPYRHPFGIAIIHQLVFGGGPDSLASVHEDMFPTYMDPATGLERKKLPPVMVALVYAAIYAALYAHRTGERKDFDFSANTYIDVYNGHLLTLEHIKTSRPSAYDNMMAELYTSAQGAAAMFVNIPTTMAVPAELDIAGMDG
ncbi:hypothetical protein BV25DRAFT_1838212 [Artomyces pyxidatus]|uniref:Uncharacterized protein n=1 Tax=Artomyces pyxidatus TaxID=48021 RepID=A0ACB8T2S2_9AGAM|nr:hypothetical protein BV25DRAFT_1838212 [Artomyces pyxidatus]